MPTRTGPALALDVLDFVAGNDVALLALVLLKLDRVVSFLVQRAGQLVAVLQHEHVELVHPLDLVGHGDELFAFAAIDHVGILQPPHLAVGGNRHDVELVDLPELGRLGHGGAGHAADFVVQLEEVLQRDRGQRLRLFLDLDAFFRLDRLVQAVAPLAAFHFAAREFIDDDDRIVFDDVPHVALIEVMRLQAHCRSGAAIPCCRPCRSSRRRPAARPRGRPHPSDSPCGLFR